LKTTKDGIRRDLIGRSCTFNIIDACGKKTRRNGTIEDVSQPDRLGIRTESGHYLSVGIEEAQISVAQNSGK